jgi:hypothetical protein
MGGRAIVIDVIRSMRIRRSRSVRIRRRSMRGSNGGSNDGSGCTNELAGG